MEAILPWLKIGSKSVIRLEPKKEVLLRHIETSVGRLNLSQHASQQLTARWHLLFGNMPPNVAALLEGVIRQAQVSSGPNGSTYYTSGYLTVVVRDKTIVTVLINGYTEKQRERGKPRLSKLCA